MSLKTALGFALAALLVLSTAQLPAADAVATVNLLTGQATASSSAGQIRPLAKGDAVYSGDLISTGPNSYLNLKYTDGSFTLIRPSSRFAVERFVYKTAPGALPPSAKPANDEPPAAASKAEAGSQAAFRLLKGGFRAVSGAVGKEDRSQYSVTTPVATIGIRGTDYTAVICDKACSVDPVIRSELSDAAVAEGGLIAGVVDGSISVDSKGKNCDKPDETGACLLGSGQFLVVTRGGDQIRLSQPPRFLTVDPTPNPATCAP
jgi:hypothetical protein